ncbi:cytochrome c oxidase assembly protein [Prosthecomicrobium pneumaticum]|uniref:Putative membrane protein n=1 Tax=Prosthecomicrobium pneumaticum TaxID=81895 RepID=A0A7W9FK77_9HYPH|nr:cytochrome c oxidase assembly protein [Prosthecomicrobium pneumaticum]MBB5752366.1 putative membrane protein [Prosthecomicrobium pneumaticum]
MEGGATLPAQVYCGPAPTPAGLAWAWNGDPFAIAFGLLLAGVVLPRAQARRAPLLLALGLLAILYLSPLCALTAALFSARVLHHVVLVAVVAPLLALALPQRGRTVPLGLLVALHTATLWLSHVPAVYDVAIRGAAGYWLMQAGLVATGWLVWRAVLAERTPPLAAVFGLFTLTVQMGLLGALITFAPAALYTAHFATTAAFALTPLEDQQLAGLVMWVPAALPYLAVALWRIGRALSGDRPAPAAERP